MKTNSRVYEGYLFIALWIKIRIENIYVKFICQASECTYNTGLEKCLFHAFIFV